MRHSIIYSFTRSVGYRRYVYPILGVLLTVIISAFQSSTTDPDVQNARTWFEQQYPSVKFMQEDVTPQWHLARKVLSPVGAKFYEVPLDKSFKGLLGELDGSQPIESQTQYANGGVTLVIEEVNSNYYANFLHINGSKSYVSSHGTTATNNLQFENMPSNFTGTMAYYSMNSNIVKGLYIENGVRSWYMYPPDDQEGVDERCVMTTVYTIFYTISGGGSDLSNPVWHVTGTTQSTTFSKDCFEYQPGLPDDYWAGLWNAFWSNQNAGGQGGGTNSNTNDGPDFCCKKLEDYQGLGTRNGASFAFAASGHIWGIQCNLPAFQGQVELINTNPIGQPVSWTFNSNYVNIVQQGQLTWPGGKKCGYAVSNRYYASVNISIGWNNLPGSTVTDEINELRWVNLAN